MAGRLADLWGARRLFLGALASSRWARCWPALRPSLELLIVARLVQAVGGGVLVPVGTAAASHLFGGRRPPPGPRGRRRADVPRDGGGPLPGRGDPPSVHAEDALASGVPTSTLAAVLAPSWRWVFYINVPVGIAALVVAWAVAQRLGHATAPRPRGPRRAFLFARPVVGRSGPDAPRRHPDAGRVVTDRHAGPARVWLRWRPFVLRGLRSRTRSRTAPLPACRSRRGPGLLPYRLRLRHRHRRGGRVRGPGAVRRPGRAAPGARCAGRGDRRRGSGSGFLVRFLWLRAGDARRARRASVRLLAMAGWTPDTPSGAGRPRAWVSSGSGSV